jgi:outer membrane protein TolC
MNWGLVMRLPTVLPFLSAIVLLLWSLETARCGAQTLPPTSALNPVASASAQPSTASMPSSVSSAIERFVSRSGRDVPASTPAEAIVGRAGPGISASPPVPPPPAGRMGGSDGTPATTPSPLAPPLLIGAAPLTPNDLRFPINLATALRLADARPLIVAAAQARTWVAEAELTQAKVLWIPGFNLAFDYLRHDGGGPDFNKGIMTAVSTNYFYGGAALYGIISTTDAIYEPLAARRVLSARHWDIQTAKNDALFETADAYFMVHQYRGMYAGALYSVERARDVFQVVAGQSRDLVAQFEIDRARNVLAELEQRSVSAREQWRVQSARLSKVLRLDPRAVVEPLERDHLQVTLIDPARALDDLMPVAVANRPELASRRALVGAAEVRVRQEKARPFLPLVVLTGFQSPGGMLIQGGIFGIGPNTSLNQWNGRDDISIQLLWQLQNMGLGNLARIKQQRGRESQAIVDLFKTQDRVAEEVNQAHARLQSAAARVFQADRALRTGFITVNGSIEGLKQTSRFGDVLVLITRPQEAIYAVELLKRALDEYFTTVADYNRAQFELFHALGYPAQEVAQVRPPGEIVPVETARPAYLPPVGNGPPPATR